MKRNRILIILPLLLFLCIAGFYLYISPKYVVPILMYHHIDDQGNVSSLSVSAENFSRQMRFLFSRNYNVLSLSDFVQAIKNKESLPRNSVVITFDDGYKDNFTHAFPILKQYNLPATIFVIVDSIGAEGYLNYEQIAEMLSSGVIEIGSHSLAGAYLPGQSKGKLIREIGLSRKKLQKRLNRGIDLFCYPIGGFNRQIQELVDKYGYQAACTTNRGVKQSYLNDDILALKRIKVKDGFANIFVFWAKLSGYYNLFRKVKKPF